jgi:RNA polymerase-binding transcription factor DksA
VEGIMKKSSRHMWRVILGQLHTHLEEHYSIVLPEEIQSDDPVSLHQLDAILSFKSDPRLDELRGALDRVKNGTFGFCLGCKEEIQDELMDVDPLRRLCVRCEEVYSQVSLVYEGSVLQE